MTIAVDANFRVAYMASLKEDGLWKAFQTAYRAGCVMGFGLVGISLLVLNTLMIVFITIYTPGFDDAQGRTYEVLMDLIAGYGLGGSSMALFGRVGGGIYTKAADVGGDT